MAWALPTSTRPPLARCGLATHAMRVRLLAKVRASGGVLPTELVPTLAAPWPATYGYERVGLTQAQMRTAEKLVAALSTSEQALSVGDVVTMALAEFWLAPALARWVGGEARWGRGSGRGKRAGRAKLGRRGGGAKQRRGHGAQQGAARSAAASGGAVGASKRVGVRVLTDEVTRAALDELGALAGLRRVEALTSAVALGLESLGAALRAMRAAAPLGDG